MLMRYYDNMNLFNWLLHKFCSRVMQCVWLKYRMLIKADSIC